MANIYTFDSRRAGLVYRTLVDAYLNRQYVFSRDRIFLPDEKIPENIEKGSARHALYLFAIAPMTKREVSSMIISRFRWHCEEHPDFLSIDGILEVSEEELAGVLKDDIGAGFSRSRAKALKRNFLIFREKYSGDPRNFFNGQPVRKAISKITEDFQEYGIKTAAMLALWFQKYGLAKFKDPQNLLPAIDIHKIRISKMTGVIDFDPKSRRIRDLLAKDFAVKLSKFCRNTQKTKNPLNIRFLDEALWILGSEACTKADALICYHDCPIYDLCSREFIVENPHTSEFERVPMRNELQECFDFVRKV